MEYFKRIYHLFVAIIANVYYGFPGKKLTVICVTGTDGKTTTTTLVYEILKNAGLKTSMITSVHAVLAGKTYDTGFHVTTPDSRYVQKYLKEAVDHGDTHMVLETTSHALAQRRVWGIPFKVGVITNVTHEHLDYHKNFQEYLATKLQVLKQSHVAIVNRDYDDLYNASKAVTKDKKVITFGMNLESDINKNNHKLHLKIPGDFNVQNALAALAVTRALQLDEDKAVEVLNSFSGVKGRMEIVRETPFRVIVDFAHTPNAIRQALKTTRALTSGKIIHVFGSAGLRDHTKRPEMGRESAAYADSIILTEEDFRTENVESIMDDIQKGIPKSKTVYRFPNRADAIGVALGMAKKGDTVIITGKGHEKSLCRRTIEYPWSDQEVVQTAFKNISRKIK